MGRAVTILSSLQSSQDPEKTKPTSDDIYNFIDTINAAISFAKSGEQGDKVPISLSDAVAALEDTAMEDKDLAESNETEKKSAVMLAHNQNGYQNRKFDKNSQGQSAGGYQRRQFGQITESKRADTSSSDKQDYKSTDRPIVESNKELKNQIEYLRRILELKREDPEERDPNRKGYEEDGSKDNHTGDSGHKPRPHFQ